MIRSLLLFVLLYDVVFHVLTAAAGTRGTTSTGQSQSRNIQHYELRPTAALREEQRQRRRLAKNQTSDWEPPSEWFHPYVSGVYATLQQTQNNSLFREFQRLRHLSRYERHFRRQLLQQPHRHRNTTALHNSSDIYHRYLKRYLLFSSSESQQESLVGGQFNQYQGVPLSQGYGTHYVHLWVGSPVPQRQTTIVDTGSHFTAFPCKGCSRCGQHHHTDLYFDPARSDSFEISSCPSQCYETTTCSSSVTTTKDKKETSATKRRCQFTQSYTEGSSWEAYQARDVLYLGGSNILEGANPLNRQYSLKFMFGCLQKETGLFVTQLADGIMGLSAHELTLPKQLYNQGKLEYNMFAMCFRKELGTSKGQGVTAGSMTLGGVASSLDTSPMLYAQNTQSYGWYTVYVQQMYVSKSGGNKFVFDTPESTKDIVKVPIDPSIVNSGKGVIVDSGTTDTYLNANALPAFLKVWKEVTGMRYTHGPIYLKRSQLERLPTILIQCRVAQNHLEYLENRKPVLGEAGLLDPLHSRDVLLAIPASHYMEYSPTIKLYTSRLYFSETRGGVLGANALQGHNVLFDWHHQRIGFSQSSCAYDLIHSENTEDRHVNFARETYGSHCVLSKAVLTQSCMETIDVSICEASSNYNNVQVLGTEIWTSMVESPGNSGDCQKLMEQDVYLQYHEEQQQLDDSIVNCTLDGFCQEHRPCHVPCLEAVEYHEKERGNKTTTNQTSNSSSGATTESVGADGCGDSFWSACDYKCQQSRIISESFGKGKNDKNVCKEVSRSTRECHVDACGRSDPCVIPFLVHAILVFEGAGGGDLGWGAAALDAFNEQFFRVAHLPEFSSVAARRVLFHPGDVDVLVVRPWYNDDEEEKFDEFFNDNDEEGVNGTQIEREALGIQLILQVSIFNHNADKIEKHGRGLLQELGVRWTNWTKPFFRSPSASTTCDASSDLYYALAKDAAELASGILEHDDFGARLVQDMPYYHNGRVLSAWTIETQIYDDYVNFLGPIGSSPYLLIFRILFESSSFFLIISIISFGIQRLASYLRWCCIVENCPRKRPFRCFGSWFIARYQQVPDADENDDSNDDDSLRDKIRGSASIPPPKQPPKEIELSSSHVFSHFHKKVGSTTTKRLSYTTTSPN